MTQWYLIRRANPREEGYWVTAEEWAALEGQGYSVVAERDLPPEVEGGGPPDEGEVAP